MASYQILLLSIDFDHDLAVAHVTADDDIKAMWVASQTPHRPLEVWRQHHRVIRLDEWCKQP